MNLLLRSIIICCGLLFIWQAVVVLFNLPPYILPEPLAVFKTFYLRSGLIFSESVPTLIETLLGFVLGVILASISAIIMAYFRPLGLWFLPVLIISQAIPTFAIAPLLVIWFGYGMASKIITAIIMLFFPVTSAFYDGLKRTEPGWLDLANTMNAKKWRIFCVVRIPAALPRWASGVRIAAVIAPIGAVIGEWVGSSRGLGFLMLNANARMQIDLMFAALLVIIVFSLMLYFGIDYLMRRWIFWEDHSE